MASVAGMPASTTITMAEQLSQVETQSERLSFGPTCPNPIALGCCFDWPVCSRCQSFLAWSAHRPSNQRQEQRGWYK